jgi:uncharacterized protein (DUF1330 family)
MPVYVISDATLRDAAAVASYRTRAAASIAKYDGRYLARGGAVEKLEGDWRPANLIIVEFPDIARARAWYASSEYADALQFRDAALTRNLILVEGMA